MTARKAGHEGAGHAPAAQCVGPSNRQEAGAHVGDGSTRRAKVTVVAPILGRTAFAILVLLAFLALTAIVGLALEHLSGVGGLALAAGVFIVALMAAVRSEGVL